MKDVPARAGALLWALVALVPIGVGAAWGLAYSVGATGVLSRGLTARYWMAVLGSAEFWQSLLLSASVALAATILALAAALALVIGLRPHLRRGLLGVALSVPLATPPIVAAFLGLQVLGASGLIARLLAAGGLIDSPHQFPALVNDRFAIGIILVHAALAAPYLALLMAQAWEQDRLGLLSEVAAGLGASASQRRRCIEIPLLLRRASGTAILLFLVILGSYEVPLLLGRQAPQMLSVLVMRKLARYDLADRPEAFVIALVYAVLLAICVWLVSRPPRRLRAR
jgi:putative spermidine/putrescine transport system permease protein